MSFLKRRRSLVQECSTPGTDVLSSGTGRAGSWSRTGACLFASVILCIVLLPYECPHLAFTRKVVVLSYPVPI